MPSIQLSQLDPSTRWRDAMAHLVFLALRDAPVKRVDVFVADGILVRVTLSRWWWCALGVVHLWWWWRAWSAVSRVRWLLKCRVPVDVRVR